MKKIVVAAVMAVFATAFTLSACNTVHGAGKDVKSAGQAVEDSANDARPNN